jgi:hypothetical protein
LIPVYSYDSPNSEYLASKRQTNFVISANVEPI